MKLCLNVGSVLLVRVQSAGFTLEIQNTNAANVMVGLRVLVGSQTTDKAPSYLEIFGRTTQVSAIICLSICMTQMFPWFCSDCTLLEGPSPFCMTNIWLSISVS